LHGEDYPAPIFMISGQGDIAMAVSAIKNGALDFIEKPFRGNEIVSRLNEAIDAYTRRQAETSASRVASLHFPGREPLTRREREVLEQFTAGASNKEAGRQLGISPRTIEDHRANIMKKLGARNAADLVRIVMTAQRRSKIGTGQKPGHTLRLPHRAGCAMHARLNGTSAPGVRFDMSGKPVYACYRAYTPEAARMRDTSCDEPGSKEWHRKTRHTWRNEDDKKDQDPDQLRSARWFAPDDLRAFGHQLARDADGLRAGGVARSAGDRDHQHLVGCAALSYALQESGRRRQARRADGRRLSARAAGVVAVGIAAEADHDALPQHAGDGCRGTAARPSGRRCGADGRLRQDDARPVAWEPPA
jgi:DNA-binding CsgD family transcriptional regulator